MLTGVEERSNRRRRGGRPAVPLHIGIDSSFLSGPLRGYSRYTLELCRHLIDGLPDARFFVYSPFPVDLPSARWELRTAASLLGFSPVTWIKLVEGRLCRRDELDVFWGSHYFLHQLPRSVRTLLTIHDLANEVSPGNLHPAHKLALRLFLRSDAFRADTIVTNSRGTAEKIRHLTGRSAAVVRPAVSERLCRQPPGTVARCLRRLGVASPYLLNVATWEPRKNIGLLVKTFVDMKTTGRLAPEYRLVLVGQRGHNRSRLSVEVGRREDISWLGHVPDDDLAALYSGAELFVFPSLYEGFGMPVAEAISCGTRVVATDTSELREAGGDAAIYTEPTRPALTEAILLGLASPDVSAPSRCAWREQAEILIDAVLDGLPGRVRRIGDPLGAEVRRNSISA